MITSIILISIIVIGFYLNKKYDLEEIGIIGFFSGTISAVLLLMHLFLLCLSLFEYNEFSESRNAFIETVKISRDTSNLYESATILKDIADYNESLAIYKYNNKTVFLGQYVDDRFELLEPIK